MELPSVEVSQSPEEKFREYLTSRSRPQRYTEQQRDMVKYIFSKHNHFDADSLIDELKRAGFQVSRATVYRTLNKLVDAGLLRGIDVGPRMYYEHDYGVVVDRETAPFARGVPLAPAAWVDVTFGAGSVASTADEMTRWLRHLSSAAQGRGAAHPLPRHARQAARRPRRRQRQRRPLHPAGQQERR